jgi:hypothetical protein
MKKQHRSRPIVWSATLALVALMLAPAASADAVFHSAHVDLNSVAGAPLRSGFVQINHANGPVNFAHDNYVLNGATPDTTFTVTLHLSHAADECSSPFVEVSVAQLQTNAAGNGEADAVFTPELIGVLGVHNSTVHVYFTVSSGSTVAYATSCQTSQLD